MVTFRFDCDRIDNASFEFIPRVVWRAQHGAKVHRVFIAQDQTVDHMRSASWTPRYFSRNGWTPELEKELLGRAREKVRELVAAHQPPEGRDEVLVRIDQVIETARKELC